MAIVFRIRSFSLASSIIIAVKVKKSICQKEKFVNVSEKTLLTAFGLSPTIEAV